MKPLLYRSLVPLAVFACQALAVPSVAPLPVRNVEAATGCQKLSHPPPTKVCGERGILESPPAKFQITMNPQYGDVSTCAEWCFSSNGSTLDACGAFSHNSKTKLCKFYAYDTLKSLYGFQKKASSAETFYATDCFHCPKLCPAADSNIMVNGGFELSDTLIGPWYDSNQKYTISSPGHNSAHALKCTSCRIYQYRALCPDQYYQLSFDYKVEQLVANPKPSTEVGELNVAMGDCDFNPYILVNQSDLGTWKTKHCSFKSTGKETGYLFMSFDLVNGDGQGPVFQAMFDNFVVKPIAEPSTLPTVGSSLLANGGFELGSLPPWYTESSIRKPKFKVVSPGLRGANGAGQSNYKLKMSGKDEYDYHYDASYGTIMLFQDLTQATDAAKRYVVSFDFRAFNSSGYRLTMRSPNSTSLFEFYDDHGIGNDVKNTTMRVSKIFSGSGGLDTLGVEFIGYEYHTFNRHQLVEVDNFSIKELAE